MDPNFLFDLEKACANAAHIIVRHKKKSSFALYAVLAECLALVEKCDLFPQNKWQLLRMIKRGPKNGNRENYLEQDSTTEQLVCRYVFMGSLHTNISRYAICLRMAKEKQIQSGDFAAYLKNNGGVNGLYFSRPLKHDNVTMKMLRLRKAIVVSRTEPFTLTLQWTTENSFAVLEVKKPEK